MPLYSHEISLDTLKSIANLQKSANDVAKPDWLENPPKYLRAAYVEMIESIEHYKFKWWKKSTPDFEAAAMEMVDILHFVLSHELVRFNGCATNVAKFFQLQFATPIDYEQAKNLSAEEFLELADDIVASLASYQPNYEKILIACVHLGIPQQKLCQWYIGKNSLNNFRQANGYKAGTYIKMWLGKEDNDHLIDIIENELTPDTTTYEAVYQGLSARYEKVQESAEAQI